MAVKIITQIRKAVRKGWGKLARHGLGCTRCGCAKFRHAAPWGSPKYMTCKCGHAFGAHKL